MFASIKCVVVALSLFIGCGFQIIAQQNEYRITDDCDYQYLSDKDEVGAVFDESAGTYYKPITVRTFYLETKRKGYLPDELSYSEFTRKTPEEQISILKQPYDEDPDCSVDNTDPECIELAEKQIAETEVSEKSRSVDLNPKCVPGSEKKASLTTKMLTNPGGKGVENINCEEQNKRLISEAEEKKKKPSTVNLIFGND